MARPEKLAHIVFWTNQIEAMTKWYETVLEAHVVFSSKSLVFLTYDGEHHRIALIGGPGPVTAVEPVKRPRVGFYHAAFAYGSLLDLLDTGIRLESEGIKPWRTINHGVTISFYYADPDGNDVELQVDRFEDPDDATRYLEGAIFESNSVGVLIDPVEMRRKLLEGVPLEELMRRADEVY